MIVSAIGHLYRLTCRRAGQRDGGAGQRGRTGRGAGGGRVGRAPEAAGRCPARACGTWRGRWDDVMNRLEFAGVG